MARRSWPSGRRRDRERYISFFWLKITWDGNVRMCPYELAYYIGTNGSSQIESQETFSFPWKLASFDGHFYNKAVWVKYHSIY